MIRDSVEQFSDDRFRRGGLYDPAMPMSARIANRSRAKRLQLWIDDLRWARDGRRFLRSLETRGRALLLREQGYGQDNLRDPRRVAMMAASARPGR